MAKIPRQPTPVAEIPNHIVLRETLRHYLEFRDLVAGTGLNGEGADGRKHVIEHSYWAIDEDNPGERKKVTVELSFWDLQRGIKELSPRKKEALYLNVILDKKQREVAEIMNISTVSVGQYVFNSVYQLCNHYFPDAIEELSNVE